MTDHDTAPGQALTDEEREALEAACLEGLVHTEHGYRYRPAKGADAVVAWLAARATAPGTEASEASDALRAAADAIESAEGPDCGRTCHTHDTALLRARADSLDPRIVRDQGQGEGGS